MVTCDIDWHVGTEPDVAGCLDLLRVRIPSELAATLWIPGAGRVCLARQDARDGHDLDADALEILVAHRHVKQTLRDDDLRHAGVIAVRSLGLEVGTGADRGNNYVLTNIMKVIFLRAKHLPLIAILGKLAASREAGVILAKALEPQFVSTGEPQPLEITVNPPIDFLGGLVDWKRGPILSFHRSSPPDKRFSQGLRLFRLPL